MTLEGHYEPSPSKGVRDQVEAYERSGGRETNTLRDTAQPIILVTTRGNQGGNVRKTPLMRVEHDGEYANERAVWWERAGAAYPPYAGYQTHDRTSDSGLPRPPTGLTGRRR